jgi:hypothetical protein
MQLQVIDLSNAMHMCVSHLLDILYAAVLVVSCCVPKAYYAHWAARRGNVLLKGGASPSDLPRISKDWIQNEMPSMYFI